ncbi:MAG: hypothetical protein WBI86_01780 [Defluviitoga tunisiensis]|jgi:predicted transcriptional regulator
MIIIKIYILMMLITIFLLYTTNFIVPLFTKKNTLYDRIKQVLEEKGMKIDSFSAKSGIIFGITLKLIKMGILWFKTLPKFIVSLLKKGKGIINLNR